MYASVLGIRRNPETGATQHDDHKTPTLCLWRSTFASSRDGWIAQELDIVLTNSDGDADRRQFLLGRLGVGATERVIDPGIEVVTERLSVDGTLSDQCRDAIQRWHGRLGTL